MMLLKLRKKSKKIVAIKESLKEYSKSGVMPWLEVNPDEMKGSLKAYPLRSEVLDLSEINEQLIVELYSR